MQAICFLSLAVAALGQGQQVPRNYKSADGPLAIKVRVNGEKVAFKGTSPVMAGSRILVPLRGVFEHVGAQLRWDPSVRTVTASGAGKTIVLPIGKSEATIDGKSVRLDQPAMIIDQVTFVPLRFLGEALGASVDWLTADRVVEITTGS